MSVILGIDAAWTEDEPSGVALLTFDEGGRRCSHVAPSYASFLQLADASPVDWAGPRFKGSTPAAADLLDAARRLAGASVDIVAVDMPLATVAITGRRADKPSQALRGRPRRSRVRMGGGAVLAGPNGGAWR